MKQEGFILRKNEGYTLIELLLVIAITGAIAIVAGTSYIQILKGRVGIAQKSAAMADLDSAAHWFSRDMILSQNTTLTNGAPPTSNMTLNWSDLTNWGADTGAVAHVVNYALTGKQLLRTYDGDVTIIGRYLTQADFSVNGKMFTVTLTSRSGLPGSTVTRSFSIEMRFDPAP